MWCRSVSRIRQILLKNRITEVELAKRTGISNQTISRFFLGKSDIGSKKLYLIAKELGVSMEELIEGVQCES